MKNKFRFIELRQSIALAGDHKISFILILIWWSACYPIILFAFSLLTKILFNAVEFSQKELLVKAFFIGAAVIVYECVSTSISGYLYDKRVILILNKMRLKLFRHMQYLPMTYFDQEHKGDLLSIVNTDVTSLGNIYQKLYSLLECIFLGFGSAIIIYVMNWKLAMVLTIIGILLVIVNSVFVKPMQELSDKVQKSLSQNAQYFLDIISGARIIKMFGGAGAIVNFEAENNELASIAYKRIIVDAKVTGINYLLSIMNVVGTLIAGVIMIIQKETDLGTVMAIISLQGAFSELFLYLGSSIAGIQDELAGMKRVFDFLNLPEETQQSSISDERNLNNVEMAVEIKNLDFCYNEDMPDIRGVNIVVNNGNKVALVGESGSGKSTILKLLIGLYKVPQNTIRIYGRPLESYSLSDLRKIFAYVPQEPYLFDGTIEENIRCGDLSADFETVTKAAIMADAHDFIIACEDGYQTKVGERGTRLSGGQRQRLSIARAILKKAPIILLDEATSALDSEHDFMIQKTMTKLAQRTFVVVAHRLSTIQNADIIYVMKDGCVVEQGTHLELMSRESKYKHLYKIQFDESQI